MGVPDGRGPAPPGAEQSVVDTLLTLFGQLDADGDGLISWNDFGSCILETSATRVRTTKSYLERPALEIWKKAEVDKAIYVPGWRKTVHCTKDKVVNIYHSPSGNPYMEYHGHQASVLTACYIPEIGKLATSGADRQIIGLTSRRGGSRVVLTGGQPKRLRAVEKAVGGRGLAVTKRVAGCWGRTDRPIGCVPDPIFLLVRHVVPYHTDWGRFGVSIGCLQQLYIAEAP